MSAELDMKWMTDRTMHIVLSAVDNKPAQCLDALDEIAQRYGERGMYSVFCALAEAFAQMSGEADKRDGHTWFGFEVEHIEKGPLNPEQVDDDSRDVMVAMRFVTAILNRDSAQSLALFDSFETPEEAAKLPAGLLKLVSAAGRYRLEHPGDEL